MARKTNEAYILELSQKRPEIIPIEEYKGSHVKSLHKCAVCSNEWQVRPNHLLSRNSSCPKCSHSNRFTSLDVVDNLLNDRGFERLSEYNGALNSIYLKHKDCGYIWETKYSNIQQGSGCPECSRGFGYNVGNNKPKEAFIYLIEILTFPEVKHYIKIGVTSQDSVNRRFNSINSQLKNNTIKVTLRKYFKCSGEKALELERNILNKYPRTVCKYEFEGKTEVIPFDYYEDIVKEIGNSL